MLLAGIRCQPFLRGSKGRIARPSKRLQSKRSSFTLSRLSPYSRLVRESLCELEIPYLLHNVGKSPGKMVEFLPPIMRENKVKDYRPETENRRKLVAKGRSHDGALPGGSEHR